VHKGSTQTNKRSNKGFKKKGAKETEMCPGLAHWTVRCTRAVHIRTLHLWVSSAPLRYNSPDCPVCHRTVWCTNGATALQRNGRLHSAHDSATVRSRSQSRGQRRSGHWTVSVRCGTRLSGATRSQCSNGRLRQNPNGWVTWLAHHEREIGSNLFLNDFGGWIAQHK
jgi:hypothetical protein